MVEELGLSLKEHWVWSDGAASQFKAKRPFYFVAWYGTLIRLKVTHHSRDLVMRRVNMMVQVLLSKDI